MASTSSTYRLKAVVSLKFSAIENMPPISVKLRIVDKHQIQISLPILFQIQPET